MEKSAEAFRTISEVASELEVPNHVLRFWELKFNQIKPMKRAGRRRYYRPEDLDLLRGIRRLLHEEGYTIKGVQKVIRQSGVEFIKQVGRLGAGQISLGSTPSGISLPTTDRIPAPEADRSTTRGASKQALAMLRGALRELEMCRDILHAPD